MTSHWVNKRVLVTGAGGFIGSHLVQRLLAERHFRGDPVLLRMLWIKLLAG